MAFPTHDGGQVVLPIVDLKPCLQKLADEGPAFATALSRALLGTGVLTPIFYCDECQAGNILAVEKSRKANIWYMSWLQCWHHLKSPSMWVVVCVVQSTCLQGNSAIVGGSSAVMKSILEHLLTDEHEAGWLLTPEVNFKQTKKAWFLGDNDAIRSVFSLKGSAGLRPCVLCSNVVKAAASSFFKDSTWKDVGASGGFKVSTDKDIFEHCDKLKCIRTKAEREIYEKASGIVLDEATLMFSKAERTKLPPSRIINDTMHCYMTNGCASWELAIFLQSVFSHTNVTLEILQQAVVSDQWMGLKASGKTQNYVKNLLNAKMFTEDNFKGEAHQTAALVPLLRYYMETLIEPASRVPPASVESFRCLCNIVSFIREVSHGLYPLDKASMQHLAALQQKHQTLFAAAYGQQHKPKHHHRMHIPTQWLAAGVPVNCEPLESKHRLYKSGVADRQVGQVRNHESFSASVLCRLLQTSLDIVKKHGLPLWELLPPIKEASLDDKVLLATTSLQTSRRISLPYIWFPFLVAALPNLHTSSGVSALCATIYSIFVGSYFNTCLNLYIFSRSLLCFCANQNIVRKASKVVTCWPAKSSEATFCVGNTKLVSSVTGSHSRTMAFLYATPSWNSLLSSSVFYMFELSF